MPNSYFRFKQFTVHQQQCALKVCTDACLFGAWVAKALNPARRAVHQPSTTNCQLLLDIGSGTGLLSLMLAQQLAHTQIHALELDTKAHQQTTQNFADSPWHNQLTAIHADANDYTAQAKYDCIISNPPFFQNDLRSDNAGKNAAKHDATLTLEALLHCIRRNLLPGGLFAVLLPYHRTNYFIGLAETWQYHPQKICNVQQTPAHHYFRTMLIMQEEKSIVEESSITIHDAAAQYSAAFTALLQEYYLYL